MTNKREEYREENIAEEKKTERQIKVKTNLICNDVCILVRNIFVQVFVGVQVYEHPGDTPDTRTNSRYDETEGRARTKP